MRDDTLVSGAALQAALEQMGQQGPDELWQALQQAEPLLTDFLEDFATKVAGKLGLSGAPQEVLAGVHSDLLAACVVVYCALRQGSYEIWRDTALGEKLQALEVAPAGPPPEQADAEKC